MSDRTTVRPSTELFERMNERRKADRLSWDEFFERLLEQDAVESNERIESGDSEQLDSIEELVRNVPGRTADEVEGRMSRR